MTQLSLWAELDSSKTEPLPLQIAAQYGFPLQHHTQDDDTIVYAVQDWIAGVAQTDDMQQAKNIWQMVQRRVKSTSVVMTLVRLPYRASNGKSYKMDFATDETLYLITQRMDTNTGIRNDVLSFLAKAGAFVDELRQDPEAAELKIAAHRQQQNAHHDAAWQAAREMGIVTRKSFMAMLLTVNPEINAGQATNDVYRGVFGMDAKGLRERLDIGAKQNPRDHMSRLGVMYVMVAEEACRIQLAGYGDDDVLPLPVIHRTIQTIAKATGVQAHDMALTLGIDLATGLPLLKASAS